MNTTLSLTPSLIGAIDGFTALLPKDTGPDVARAFSDVMVAVRGEVAAAIEANGPRWPVVGGPIRHEMSAVADLTLANFTHGVCAKLGA
jgi:hypothetical protein